ncbi:hypothetical protein Glove_198g23 [Diversispora epigaea]|uniref:Uncharacterized protein n=1 Tax=Diversispora epigaea TaxID=1348612 RepID=A0A397IRL4_9GLOM|nr:hypothetical protein Glove_198g23 [Diversispora epigaea]
MQEFIRKANYQNQLQEINHQQQQEKNDQKRHQKNQRQPTFQHNNSTTSVNATKWIKSQPHNNTTMVQQLSKMLLLQYQQQIKQQYKSHKGIDPLMSAVDFVEQLPSMFNNNKLLRLTIYIWLPDSMPQYEKYITEAIPIILLNRTAINRSIQERNVKKNWPIYSYSIASSKIGSYSNELSGDCHLCTRMKDEECHARMKDTVRG